MDTSSSNSRILASPLAKKIASEKNIDLSTIQGSGDNGRITKVDVENYKVKEKEISKLVDNRVSQSVSATQKSIDVTESFE